MSESVIKRAEVVEDFIESMQWGPDTPDSVKTLVIGNVRGFWSYLHSDRMEGCQQAVDEAFRAPWHKSVIIRGIPVWVCADEFTEDKSVGINWGPEQVWAIRRDDGTQFDLTGDEIDHWSGVASEEYEPPSLADDVI